MSRGLPTPLRREPQEVVVVTTPVSDPPVRLGSALARFALSMTPDVIEAFDRALRERRLLADQRTMSGTVAHTSHAETRAVQHTEVEINTWDPFPRRVRMTTTTQWETTSPLTVDAAELDERHSRFRRAGIGAVGVGGALAIATLGVLANRGGLLRRR